MNYSLFVFKPNQSNIQEYYNVNHLTYDVNKIKTDIMNDIQPRDYHIIDHTRSFKISSLIIRKSGYIIKLNMIRSIITKDTMYLFNAQNDVSKQFINFIEQQFQNSNIISKDLPFEFKMLELILIYICNNSDLNINQLSNSVQEISLENVRSSNLTSILSLQNKLINAEQEYFEIKTVISGLMKSEEDMFNIYLSKKSVTQNAISKEEKAKIDELEILLENYDHQINEDLSLVKKLINEVESKLRLTEINLADFRNRIAIYNTHLSLYSISISGGAFFAAIFGMNLKSNLEEYNGGLYITFGIIIILCLVIFKLVYLKLKKITSNVIGNKYLDS